MALKRSKFLLVNECPCPYEVAAQVHIVLRTARQSATAIYRGRDARGMLHAHGKHDQDELYDVSIHGPVATRIAWGLPAAGGGVNRPGSSEHECKSDGVGKAGPVGRDLPRWQVGVDSGRNTPHDRAAIETAARKYGWRVRHHYGAGDERHHWCFDAPPRPRNAWQRARVAYWRRRLPSR
jgi:hypothetical protein